MEDRETYTEALIPLAARLVATVHDEGTAATRAVLNAINAIPAPAGMNPADALAVVLAAMVDPTKSLRQLLDWTRGFGVVALHPDHVIGCNPFAIEMGVSGVLQAQSLSPEECIGVVDILHRIRQWPVEVVAEHMGADLKDVRRWANVAGTRARRKGKGAA